MFNRVVRKKKDASQNDVLSQHQLDLIQQIMQQTAKAVVSSPSSQSPSSTSKTKTWTVQSALCKYEANLSQVLKDHAEMKFGRSASSISVQFVTHT
ncbi:hypothetical protein M8J76_000194 [Diaphorina citri]|nr:hypothetical protein M8J76_000194 [Diaphorina citri]